MHNLIISIVYFKNWFPNSCGCNFSVWDSIASANLDVAGFEFEASTQMHELILLNIGLIL